MVEESARPVSNSTRLASATSSRTSSSSDIIPPVGEFRGGAELVYGLTTFSGWTLQNNTGSALGPRSSTLGRQTISSGGTARRIFGNRRSSVEKAISPSSRASEAPRQ